MTMFADSVILGQPYAGTDPASMPTTHLLAEWMELKHSGPDATPDDGDAYKEAKAYAMRLEMLEMEINNRIPTMAARAAHAVARL